MEQRSTFPSQPVCVIPLGENAFLCGCVDWMLDVLKEKGLRPSRTDDHYHIASVVRRRLNDQTDWQETVNAFNHPDTRFIFYQTLPFQYFEEERQTECSPDTLPSKLTELLYQRFLAHHGREDKGLIIIPCDNQPESGTRLKHLILRCAAQWELPVTFTIWAENDCLFINAQTECGLNTPTPEAPLNQENETGYKDEFMTSTAPYPLVLPEIQACMERELPFLSAGLQVLFAANQDSCRQTRERLIDEIPILGAYPAYLSGLSKVTDMINDPDLGKYIREAIFEEILPTLALPGKENQEYVESVMNRLGSPYHPQKLDVFLKNGLSQWTKHILPILNDYCKQKGKPPVLLATSLAALIRYYLVVQTDAGFEGNLKNTTYKIEDTYTTLYFFSNAAHEYLEMEDLPALVKNILGNESLWGADLNTLQGLADLVEEKLHLFLSIGSLYTIRHAS